MSNQKYQQNFFIVPSYILELPALTFTLLKFYETIFQFWNHGKDCFLSNSMIMERTGIKSISSIIDAFKYFEAHGQMRRVMRNGQRYIIRPEQKIQTECSDNSTIATARGGIEPAIGGYRHGDRGGIATAIHNTKKLNKEFNCVGEGSTHTQNLNLKKQTAEQKALNSEEAKEIFEEKFFDREVTLEKIFEDCRSHYEQKKLWPTEEKFLKWLHNEKPVNYKKREKMVNREEVSTTDSDQTPSPRTTQFTQEQLTLASDYGHALKTRQLDAFFPDESQRESAKALHDLICIRRAPTPKTELQVLAGKSFKSLLGGMYQQCNT